jgi:hypothetical protein
LCVADETVRTVGVVAALVRGETGCAAGLWGARRAGAPPFLANRVSRAIVIGAAVGFRDAVLAALLGVVRATAGLLGITQPRIEAIAVGAARGGCDAHAVAELIIA